MAEGHEQAKGFPSIAQLTLRRLHRDTQVARRCRQNRDSRHYGRPSMLYRQLTDIIRMSPDDRICLMGLILDGLQALPKSNEKYVARTRGEL